MVDGLANWLPHQFFALDITVGKSLVDWLIGCLISFIALEINVSKWLVDWLIGCLISFIVLQITGGGGGGGGGGVPQTARVGRGS